MRPKSVTLSASDHLQTRLIQIGLAVVASALLVLIFFVRSTPSFPFDLQITRAVQSFNLPWFDALMVLISATGFFPFVVVWIGVIILTLFILGYRWEAVGTLFAAVGNAVLETIVKWLVVRPRPDPALVHVFRNLNGGMESFPAGHVMANVAIMGFLIYLLLTLGKASWVRLLAIVILASQIALIGVSRIYEGEHWFSDVLGGYLLGILLLAATIGFYQWGRRRFAFHR